MMPRSPRRLDILFVLSMLGAFLWPIARAGDQERATTETTAGWVKSPKNPVLGGDLGTCFDVSVLKEGDSLPHVVLLAAEEEHRPGGEPGWHRAGPGRSSSSDPTTRPIGRTTSTARSSSSTATSIGCGTPGRHGASPGSATPPAGTARPGGGRATSRCSRRKRPWEKVAVMCPHVLHDEQAGLYRMWYSGGEQYEPDAIGHATSRDGLKWEKHADNPVFKPDPASPGRRTG